jgi:hypothetical protein
MQSYKQGKQTNTDRFVAEGKKNKKEQSQYCDEAQERKGNSIIQKTRVALRLASIANVRMRQNENPNDRVSDSLSGSNSTNFRDRWKESGIWNMPITTRANGGNSINDFSSKSNRNATSEKQQSNR